VSARQYRHLLTLQSLPQTDDTEGGQTGDWADVTQFWGDVQAISAREQSLAGAIQSLATYRVMTNYDARITGERRFKRIAPTGPSLQILGVRDVDGRQRWMEVDCSEVV